jgi:hypothetical protein
VPAIFDEVQVWTEHGDGKDIETMLTQFREYAVPPLFFHQTLDQWKHLLSLVRSNVGCRMLLRCDDPDATTLAREYAAWGVTDADLKDQHPAEHQYAVLRINNNKVGPLSVVPDGWPDPLPIHLGMVTAWQGTQQRDAWQQQSPTDSPDPQFDRAVCQLVYNPPDRAALDAFARKQSDAAWQRYLDRWAVIQQHQRWYLLAHPWLIPDRMERQRWLSRLLVATPKVLLDVADARRWQAMEQAVQAPKALATKPTKPPRDEPKVPAFAAIDQPVEW